MAQIEVQPLPDYEPNNWAVFEGGTITSEHKKKKRAESKARALYDSSEDMLIIKTKSGGTQEVLGKKNDPLGGIGKF